MANYKMQKHGKKSGKVMVAPEGFEIHVPALIVCALIAFGMWLYIVGIAPMVENHKASEETTAPAEVAEVVTQASFGYM